MNTKILRHGINVIYDENIDIDVRRRVYRLCRLSVSRSGEINERYVEKLYNHTAHLQQYNSTPDDSIAKCISRLNEMSKPSSYVHKTVAVEDVDDSVYGTDTMRIICVIGYVGWIGIAYGIYLVVEAVN